MRTVTIEVSGWEEMKRRAEAAFRGEPQGEFICFESMESLWKTMTPQRFALLQALAGKEPMSLRAVSRLAKRDVKTIHTDVHALLKVGVLERGEDGKIVFPYDAIHVDFMVEAAA